MSEETRQITLTEGQLRTLVKETVHETLKSMGADPDDLEQMQRDFRHLRDWRRSVETVKRQGLISAVGILTAGVLGAIWLGLRAMFGQQ